MSQKTLEMKQINAYLNSFPMKWWLVIYSAILIGHITSLLIGYDLSTLGFLLSVVTYYLVLTKTKLWNRSSFFYAFLMFLIFLVISILLMFTNKIGFYEICLLIGVYEWTLMALFIRLPIKRNENIDYKKFNFIRILLCLILLSAGLYYIPLGIYGIYQKLEPEDVSIFAYPLYVIAIIIVLSTIVAANIFIKPNNKENKEVNDIFISQNDKVDIDKISDFFSKSDLFLKHNFSMEDLSEHTGIEKRRLSYLLNSCMNTNYYRTIAYYRIQKVKDLLKNHDNFTLDYVASQCGFTSIPVFIKYFKIFEETTPNKYREKINLKE